MIQSMTGFAERSFSARGLRLKITVKTLNHRFFDWSYKGAPIGEAETVLRAEAQRRLHRGRVEVGLDLLSLDPGRWDFAVNEPLLEKILAQLERVARRTGRPVPLTLDGLFRIPQLVELSRKGLSPEEVRFIERSFGRTLDRVVRVRAAEGRATARRIRGHVRTIRSAVARVETAFRRQPALLDSRLRGRLRELTAVPPPEERIAAEAALLAQRADLAEEIARLKAHLRAVEELLRPSGREPVGKKLDFLAQELSREANTASSKSQDMDIIREALAVKNEVESIRQHVANLE